MNLYLLLEDIHPNQWNPFTFFLRPALVERSASLTTFCVDIFPEGFFILTPLKNRKSLRTDQNKNEAAVARGRLEPAASSLSINEFQTLTGM